MFSLRLDNKSRMSGDVQVRFCESLRVRSPWATRRCILAKSKFKLRHAIKKMHRVLEKLQMKTHPDKTFIGRREKSFSFLGFQFCNQVLMISKASFENHQAKRLQLQEQQAPTQRLVDYGRRWLGWFTAGVTLASGYAESIKLALADGVGVNIEPLLGLCPTL